MEAQITKPKKARHGIQGDTQGFSLVEAMAAVSLGTIAIMAAAATMQLGQEQLRLLEQRQFAELFTLNLAAFIRANPAGDYRWQGSDSAKALNGSLDCRRSSCDTQMLANYELRYAHNHLFNSAQGLRFRILHQNDGYRLEVGVAGEPLLMETYIRP
jgi:Tfp pilus assembly protein PilV